MEKGGANFRSFVEVTECQCWPMHDAWDKKVLYGAYWRLIRCFDGGAWMCIDEVDIELKSNSVYLLPPNCAMNVWQSGEPIQFFIHFLAPDKYNRVLQRYYSFEVDEFIDMRISSIVRGMEDGVCVAEADWLESVSLTSYVLSKVPLSDLLDSTVDHEVVRLMNRMRDYPQFEYCVANLASEMGMCQDSFIRRFKRFSSTTPYQFLISQRLRLAIHLLEHSNESLVEIAEKCGLKDQFNFSRVFKKRIGKSPGQYRSIRQRI
ncbi:helix-turn-helix transcriptional regulator [Puniceicoccaceae bacterium K14]|nr:helix-turn-helix transcriptional regulator [Puniceicoccaceae bacterium K14]